MTDIRERILEIFSSSREESDAPYDEKNFLEFLVCPAGEDLRNTFRGARLFGRFMSRIEDEFGICFPLNVMEKSGICRNSSPTSKNADRSRMQACE